MKLLRYAGLVLSLIALPAMAVEKFIPGRDYEVMPTPQPVETGDKVELREFFWYGCPHCFALEGPLTAYVKKLPANARFVRTPAVGKSWLIHAQMYYAFEAIGATDKLHPAFFDAWHVKERSLNDEETITKFVGENGVDKAKFKDAFNSFGVRARVEQAKQLNVGFMVTGVPLLVVDGRYRTSPYLAGGQEPNETKRAEKTMEVVDFLIKKAAQERKKAK
jgi:thiol:disulfide interchange protein DsbA